MTRKRTSGLVAKTILLALLTASSVSQASAKTTHKVRQGDTLWVIAKRNHISPAALAHANGLTDKSTLKLDSKLIVPSTQSSVSSKHKSIAKSKVSTSRHSRIVKATTGSNHVGYAVCTKKDSVALRSGPGKSFICIYQMQRGTTAKLLARKGKWVKVALSDGKCGYVNAALLTRGSSAKKSIALVKSQRTQIASSRRQMIVANNSSPKESGSLVRTALNLQGTSYVRGGTSRGGFDCSGFTRYVFAKNGVNLPHNSAAQASHGTPIPRSQLRSGDLVFFNTRRGRISHVGIYIGDGKFVHAANPGRGVRTDSLNSGYYSGRFRGARRVQ